MSTDPVAKKLDDKPLCKLIKAEVLEDHPDVYRKLVRKPTHLCTKCGRVSNDKHRLCEPEKLDD